MHYGKDGDDCIPVIAGSRMEIHREVGQLDIWLTAAKRHRSCMHLRRRGNLSIRLRFQRSVQRLSHLQDLRDGTPAGSLRRVLVFELSPLDQYSKCLRKNIQILCLFESLNFQWRHLYVWENLDAVNLLTHKRGERLIVFV